MFVPVLISHDMKNDIGINRAIPNSGWRSRNTYPIQPVTASNEINAHFKEALYPKMIDAAKTNRVIDIFIQSLRSLVIRFIDILFSKRKYSSYIAIVLYIAIYDE